MNDIKNCPLCGCENFTQFLQGKDYFLSGESFDILECTRCKFRFTSPIPVKENIGRYYKSVNYVSHTDSRKGLINKIYHLVKQYSLLRKARLIESFKKQGKLLDIGCGSGAFPAFMRDSGWDVAAVEPDEDTRKKAMQAWNMDVSDEPALDQMAEASMDVITLWHVLEHVFELQQRMQQILRLLKNDGVLVLALPNADSHDAAYYGKYWAAYDLPRHLYHFTPDSVRFLAADYGFEVVKILPMKFDAYYVSMLSEKYRGGNTLAALYRGFLSNKKAWRSGGNYSSLIYILRRKTTF